VRRIAWKAALPIILRVLGVAGSVDTTKSLCNEFMNYMFNMECTNARSVHA
tara:strand:- start:307 stop:459 length:153 start_codon:yes stop_codon:yes gene_type:complete